MIQTVMDRKKENGSEHAQRTGKVDGRSSDVNRTGKADGQQIAGCE